MSDPIDMDITDTCMACGCVVIPHNAVQGRVPGKLGTTLKCVPEVTSSGEVDMVFLCHMCIRKRCSPKNLDWCQLYPRFASENGIPMKFQLIYRQDTPIVVCPVDRF